MRMNPSRSRGHRRLVAGRLWAVAAGVLVASMVAAGPVAAQEDAAGGFSDVTEGVHKPAIDALAEMGVFEGTECAEGMFCPGDEMKRWTMGVWLVRVLDDEEPAAATESSFADVESDEWWLAHVERLAELEVTKGCKTEPLRFCPDRSVTRAQMATFLVRAFDLAAAEPAGFTDTTGNTHETNIDALAAARVTAGCKAEPLSYCPDKPVTRSQMATFLARALGLVEVPQPAEETTEEEETAEPEEAPEEEETGPRLVADPATVPREGSHDFTLSGTGFDPGLTVYVLECIIPGDPVTHETPADELAAARDKVDRSDCDLGTAQPVTADSSGSFSVQRSATIGMNFMWAASDIAETQSAGAPIFVVVTPTVTVGDRHGCILEGDGTVGCGGSNISAVSDAPDGTFIDVDAGSDLTCGVRTDGTVTCWGDTSFGMGEVPEGTFNSVSAGAFNVCGVRTDGTVTCWGFSTLVDATPRRWTFSTVSVGGYHACGLRTSGTVACWGPDEATVDATPGRAFTAVDSGGWHSCGLRPDGTVTCWGGNRWGQIDAPSGTFKAIAAGWSHSCGLRNDGTIECWGDNRYGQTEPPTGSFVSIDAGGYYNLVEVRSGYSCGIGTNARLTCWGNRSGS